MTRLFATATIVLIAAFALLQQAIEIAAFRLAEHGLPLDVASGLTVGLVVLLSILIATVLVTVGRRT